MKALKIHAIHEIHAYVRVQRVHIWVWCVCTYDCVLYVHITVYYMYIWLCTICTYDCVLYAHMTVYYMYIWLWTICVYGCGGMCTCDCWMHKFTTLTILVQFNCVKESVRYMTQVPVIHTKLVQTNQLIQHVLIRYLNACLENIKVWLTWITIKLNT